MRRRGVRGHAVPRYKFPGVEGLLEWHSCNAPPSLFVE